MFWARNAWGSHMAHISHREPPWTFSPLGPKLWLDWPLWFLWLQDVLQQKGNFDKMYHSCDSQVLEGIGRGPLLVTRPHSRRWAVGKWAKLHLYLQPLPIAGITAWAPPPVRSAAALDSHRSSNPTVNCACEGSRLRAPYENLMPDDLRWSWGGDASAGEWLQIQIIISREVWLHKDHNKSTAYRLISKPSQWAASDI